MFFFFNDTATTEIYTLSLHDALPILNEGYVIHSFQEFIRDLETITYCSYINELIDISSIEEEKNFKDRKSTRLNSSHANISYAVFCLKKKKKTKIGRTYICNHAYPIT